MEPIRLQKAAAPAVPAGASNGSHAASDLSGQEVGAAVAGILAAAEHAAAEITRRSAEIQDEIRGKLETLLGALTDVQNMVHGIAQDVAVSLDDITAPSGPPQPDEGAHVVALGGDADEGYLEDTDQRYEPEETYEVEEMHEPEAGADDTPDRDAEPKRITPQDLIWEIS